MGRRNGPHGDFSSQVAAREAAESEADRLRKEIAKIKRAQKIKIKKVKFNCLRYFFVRVVLVVLVVGGVMFFNYICCNGNSPEDERIQAEYYEQGNEHYVKVTYYFDGKARADYYDFLSGDWRDEKCRNGGQLDIYGEGNKGSFLLENRISIRYEILHVRHAIDIRIGTGAMVYECSDIGNKRLCDFAEEQLNSWMPRFHNFGLSDVINKAINSSKLPLSPEAYNVPNAE